MIELFLPLFSGRITGIKRCLTLDLERGLGGQRFFLLTGEARCSGRGGLRLESFSRGLFDLARLPGLLTGSCLGLALGLSLLYRGVVRTGAARETYRDYFFGPRAPPVAGQRS